MELTLTKLIHQEPEKRSRHKNIPLSPFHRLPTSQNSPLTLCPLLTSGPADPPAPWSTTRIFSSHTQLTSQLDFKDQNAASLLIQHTVISESLPCCAIVNEKKTN